MGCDTLEARPFMDWELSLGRLYHNENPLERFQRDLAAVLHLGLKKIAFQKAHADERRVLQENNLCDATLLAPVQEDLVEGTFLLRAVGEPNLLAVGSGRLQPGDQ